jgi:hypothetical protein
LEVRPRGVELAAADSTLARMMRGWWGKVAVMARSAAALTRSAWSHSPIATRASTWLATSVV